MDRRRAVVGAIVVAALGGALFAWSSSRDRRTLPRATIGGASIDATTAPTLEVELSGCSAVRTGPVCEWPAGGALRVWVKAPADAVSFEPHASTVLAELEGGTLHRVTLAPGATALQVTWKKSASGPLGPSFRLAPNALPPWLERARSLRHAGDVDGAAALARPAEGAADAGERAFAMGFRARLELAAGRVESSFALLRDAVRLHRVAGRSSDAADDSFALAFALNQRSHRYKEAREVLDGVHADVANYPDGRVRELYYRGTLATETGDARSALALLREARAQAARLGLAQLERNATNAYALQLELLGRVREALDLLTTLEAALTVDAPPCERAEIAINIGYGSLLANEQTHDRSADLDAITPLARALSLSEQGCTDRYLRTAALGNLAFAALQRGERAKAREHLARARKSSDAVRGVEALFWHDIEGRIALEERDPALALASFDEEARLADATLSFEASWRAAVGQGASLEALARNDEAIAAYRRAEDLLGELGVLVPLGEGRGTFLGDRSRSARWGIDLLVRLGRADEALAMARSSRARVVAALAQSARTSSFKPAERALWESALGDYRGARAALDAEATNDWKLSRAEAGRARAARPLREAALRSALDAALALLAGPSRGRPRLAPLPEDATTLAFHPARSGWLEMVADRSGVIARRIPTLPDAAAPTLLSETLLVPMQARLTSSATGTLDGGAPRRLRVLAYGALRQVDFHELPLDGQPLMTRMAVEYPLDLPERGQDEQGAITEDRAVVVFDPTLDLSGTHNEAAHVTRALREEGWVVDSLGGPMATSAAVAPLLERARLLHYAGHGVFGGREAWESALPLAGGGHLTIGDVLASRRVPTRVVLSGCETARAAADAPAESLGLAQAFVVAGSEFVIAPVRPVADPVAARMSIALYGALASRGAVDAAATLREAQLQLRAEDPRPDWGAFRVVRR